MSQLVAIAFDNTEDARVALKRVRDIEGVGKIRIEDTAIVERDLAGKYHVKNEASSTTEAASAVGGVLGLIFIVAFPIFGIAVGAGLGALAGRFMHTGVDRAFVEDVKAKLQPGRSALFMVVKESEPDAVRAAMRTMHGELIQTTLSREDEEALKSAIGDKSAPADVEPETVWR